MTALPAAAGTLEVTVTNVRNTIGRIRVAVCSEQQFLGTDCTYVAQAPARVPETTVRVEGVPPGTWSVQVFHDENENNKVDRNVLGLPTEGLAFSNDAPFNFGPPKFRDAAFRLTPEGGRIRLALRYLF